MSCGETRKAASKKRADRHHRGDLTRGADEGQAEGRHRTGSGNPVAVSAAASDNAPIPAAVQPASGRHPDKQRPRHTARRLACRSTFVMVPRVWRAPGAG